MTLYYSTNRRVPDVDLGDALWQGQAGDKGLYLPREIPKFDLEFLKRASEMSYSEMATRILTPYTKNVFSEGDLRKICEAAYTFDVPLERVSGSRYLMRLDQGPTASFKDFAARFMGQALGKLVKERGKELLILTATSGDTGSAIADAFYGVPGIKVVVLFPVNEVSHRQRRQMTTLGGNITTLAMDGKFDHCQALVKEAFADPDMKDLNLSSANSINIGRLLPQSVYYVYAASRLVDIARGEKILFSVPCGNFGDLMGGILASRMGIPIQNFVVATNANNEVPIFLKTSKYSKIEPSLQCISNAMNVGHPSNLARLVDLYGGWMDEKGNLLEMPDIDGMRRDFVGISVSDEETRRTIKEIFDTFGTMIEPHGAVGWSGLMSFIKERPDLADITAVSLETAHPAKFPEEIEALTGKDPDLPPSLMGLDDKEESTHEMTIDYRVFKNYLQDTFR